LGKLFKDIRNKQISSETILDVSVYASKFSGEIIAAIEILWITHASILLQAWITERSRHAISSIAQMGESTVITIRDGKETEIPSNQLSVEDIVKFKTGDRLSVDGFIIEGIAEIDESSITGRSEPMKNQKATRFFRVPPDLHVARITTLFLDFPKFIIFQCFQTSGVYTNILHIFLDINKINYYNI